MKAFGFIFFFLAIVLLTLLIDVRRLEDRARNDALFFATAFPAPSGPSGSAENTRPKNTHAGDSF